LNYTARWDTVATIEYVRTDEYYDLHVPGAEHYLAEGIWHHNTGKTFGCLWRLHLAALKYPGMRALMVRKTQEDLTASAVVTYRERVLASGEWGVVPFGGSKFKPAAFGYPNGSQILVGGLDKADKVMSRDYDLVYCFVGGTRVTSDTAIEKAYTREYSGPLVTIRTAAGNELTGTPNHPILTDAGWIALGQLKIGDHVISRSLAQKELVRHPDVNDAPPTIAEVARALAVRQGAVTERMVGVDMDFHGDGWNGYVDVVSTGSQLQAAGVATVGNPSSQQRIRGRDLDLFGLVGLSAADKVLLRARLPFGGSAGYVRKPFSPFGITAETQARRVALGQGGKAAKAERVFERAVADPDGLRNDVQPPFTGEVAPDRVVHVGVTHTGDGTVCHVYNLQTAGHCYVANNIIVHNCNEAWEIDEDAWQKLTTRVNRPGKVMPYNQVFGDTNPQGPGHWIYKRAHGAKKMTMLYSVHEDNPELWDGTAWTGAGLTYLATLDNLSGHLYERLRKGLWVAADGAVYPGFARQTHVQTVDASNWPAIICADFGLTHPTAILTVRFTKERMHIEREVYQTGLGAEDAVSLIVDAYNAAGAELVVPDPASAQLVKDTAKRCRVRLPDKSIVAGIKRVTDWIPNLTVDPSCEHTIAEFETYAYKQGGTRDVPEDKNNHSMDALRYGVMAISSPRKLVFG
jgi:phage terminase large subunit